MRTTVVCLSLIIAFGAAFPAWAQSPAGNVSRKLDLAADWPWWRGPTHNGLAALGQNPPLKWSETENVIWSAPIPGRGHGSPTVVGDQVFLATAEEQAQVQSVLCYDRNTGKHLWKTVIHQGNFEKKGNAKSSLAACSIACDGERLFVNFLNAGAVYLTALDRAGKQLWQSKVSDFVMHQGYGASPAIFGELVIAASDNKGGGAIAAFERATGKVVWKQDRPAKPNYTSPVLLQIDGRDQLLFSGCDLVSSFDPRTGKKLWEVEGSTTECVTSIVTDGERVFTSGGYPRSHVSAIRADGSGKTDWENKDRVYVPSMIVNDGHLYAALDAGVAMCWKSDTGEEVWKGRLGGTFSGSLVLVGDNLMATNESGRTYIFKANPTAFELVAENQLGDQSFSTPAVCGSRIYLRTAKTTGGERQEMLYCIGAR